MPSSASERYRDVAMFVAGMFSTLVATAIVGWASAWTSQLILGEVIDQASQGAFIGAICVAVYLLWDRLDAGRLRSLAAGVVFAGVAAGLYWVLNDYVSNLSTPHTWDFLSFYLFGSVGDASLPFYERASFEQVVAAAQLPYAPEPIFLEVLYNHAFPYPPQSMWLFLPLGGQQISAANWIWNVFNAVTLLLGVAMLARFIRSDRLSFAMAFAISAASVMCNTAAHSTVFLGQTNFLILALICLSLMARSPIASGAWPALAVIVKPWLAVLPFGLFLRRSWSSLGWFMIASLLIAVATVLMFGWEQMYAYLFDNPAGRMPARYFIGSENQSLLGTLLRNDIGTGTGSPLRNPVWLGLVFVALIFTSFLVVRLPQSDRALSVSLLLCFGLIAYPASLVHYSLLLLIPIFTIAQRLERCSIATALQISALAAIVFLFVDLRSFYAVVLVWIMTAALAGSIVLRRRESSISIKPAAPG